MAAPKPKETNMIIGTFTYQRSKDTYTGELATFSGSVALTFQPLESRNENSPSHRAFAETKSGTVEIGAAWQKSSKDNKPYMAVRLDDPTWAKPLNCALIEGDTGFILVWQREAQKARKAA